MMKNLLIVFTVLAIASTANAAMLLSVNGEVDPAGRIELNPSDTAIIDIWGDGQTDPYAFLLGIVAGGPGTLDISNVEMVYPGSEAAILEFDDADFAGALGLNNPFIYMELTDIAVPPALLDGTLVDNIVFHCEGEGEVTLMLMNGDGELMDTQVIHQIPEPITMALLGIGGLFLRRRK